MYGKIYIGDRISKIGQLQL